MAWAPDYASAAELKALLRIPSSDTVDDTELALAVTAAARAIDRATQRQFGVVAAAEARTFDATWSREHGRWKATIDDLMTSTDLDVVASGSSLASSAFELRERNAPQKGQPWVRILTDQATAPVSGFGPCTLEITAIWGWTAVPATIKQACLTQASRLFKRRDAPFGVAGSPDMGSEIRLLAKVDPDVEVMTRSYRRDWPLL